jgi:hypothetical protein
VYGCGLGAQIRVRLVTSSPTLMDGLPQCLGALAELEGEVGAGAGFFGAGVAVLGELGSSFADLAAVLVIEDAEEASEFSGGAIFVVLEDFEAGLHDEFDAGFVEGNGIVFFESEVSFGGDFEAGAFFQEEALGDAFVEGLEWFDGDTESEAFGSGFVDLLEDGAVRAGEDPLLELGELLGSEGVEGGLAGFFGHNVDWVTSGYFKELQGEMTKGKGGNDKGMTNE